MRQGRHGFLRSAILGQVKGREPQQNPVFHFQNGEYQESIQTYLNSRKMNYLMKTIPTPPAPILGPAFCPRIKYQHLASHTSILGL